MISHGLFLSGYRLIVRTKTAVCHAFVAVPRRVLSAEMSGPRKHDEPQKRLKLGLSPEQRSTRNSLLQIAPGPWNEIQNSS